MQLIGMKSVFVFNISLFRFLFSFLTIRKDINTGGREEKKEMK